MAQTGARQGRDRFVFFGEDRILALSKSGVAGIMRGYP